MGRKTRKRQARAVQQRCKWRLIQDEWLYIFYKERCFEDWQRDLREARTWANGHTALFGALAAVAYCRERVALHLRVVSWSGRRVVRMLTGPVSEFVCMS